MPWSIAVRMPTASGARQPDDRGWGALLAHRRLAILDLSPAGVQPMIDPVTGHVITFNGEIYNYRDLRRRLESEGQRFQSSGDTAVMLRALGLHGPQAVGWLRGMFAFASWDQKQRRLLLARDHLGIKPLYVARSTDPNSGWSVAFASELRALLASGLLGTPQLDPQAAASCAWNGFVVGPNTAVKGVELLWPGRLMEFDGAGKEIAQRGLLAYSERARRIPRWMQDDLAAILEERFEAPPRQRRAARGLPVGRRGLLRDGQSRPARGAKVRSTPSRLPSKSRNSTRGRSRGRSPRRSAPSTTRWC